VGRTIAAGIIEHNEQVAWSQASHYESQYPILFYNRQMTLPNDIDLHLQLGKHGWSQALIWIDGVPKDFTMTHVFSDPLSAICESAIELSKGLLESVFFWHDEPGTYIWNFSRIEYQNHLLYVTIREFTEIIHNDTSQDAYWTGKFIVTRDFWIQLVIAELDKLSKLLTFPHFQTGRSKEDFPAAHFGSLCRLNRESKVKKNS
jgi:hypothetical protein